MTNDQRQRVADLFDDALEVSPEKRESFLNQQCLDDDQLKTSVLKLLEAHHRSGDFLNPPVPAAAYNLLSDYTDDVMVGQEVGPYRLTALIASGGMGTVFKAVKHGQEGHEPVALKLWFSSQLVVCKPAW